MLEEIFRKFVKQCIKNYEEENEVKVKSLDIDYLIENDLRELAYGIEQYINENAELE